MTPIDIVESVSAYGYWLKEKFKNESLKVVIGRDARLSGEMVENLCIGTLQSLGINIINLGLSTTPTVEFAVPKEKAQGGIILTASHNPKQWNALKLLNDKGEFISKKDGEKLLEIIRNNKIDPATIPIFIRVFLSANFKICSLRSEIFKFFQNEKVRY